MSKHQQLFGTDGIRGKAGKFPIEPNTIQKIGTAAALVLGKKQKLFVIGKDTRESSDMIERELSAAFAKQGIQVILAGVTTTPAISFVTRSIKADAGIMISASHNPAQDNGIKFFNAAGKKISEKDESAIENEVYKQDEVAAKNGGEIKEDKEVSEEYIQYVITHFSDSINENTKIILDAANGAAYQTAPRILNALNLKIIEINTAPNGKNINENSGAVYPEVAQEKVLEEKADIGIVLDGDADRIVLIDEKGDVVDGDTILAMVATHLLKKSALTNKSIVVTNYSNLALDELIESMGGRVFRVQNGDKYVMRKMQEENSVIGGENTGHIIISNINPTGDGIVAALQVIQIMSETGKSLHKLASILKKYPQVVSSVSVEKKIAFENIPGFNEELERIRKELGSKGRCFVRYSGTEMKARIMVEGENKKEITQMAERLANLLRN